ncbi:putative protein OS=Streptomyces griseomycini OX=66895 GN=FHS37_007730 PE=4 SV=1 [Streptomyces griseomycini]|uniref:Uncharacterized protein n=1 Tax=Streptomyces griseomycini TaxID=66895 RepID=A0A7W7PYP3_9ACTN|nr:hypothetical protein [Streptomyces griseomycini]GGR58566.1 hypothetical protein GCM10015536_73860 [Streptomyces griseomycini]
MASEVLPLRLTPVKGGESSLGDAQGNVPRIAGAGTHHVNGPVPRTRGVLHGLGQPSLPSSVTFGGSGVCFRFRFGMCQR